MWWHFGVTFGRMARCDDLEIEQIFTISIRFFRQGVGTAVAHGL
jgi:hypothetical protein